MAATLRFDREAMVLAVVLGGASETPVVAPAGEIEKIRRREPEAWRRLFEREMPAIYSYAFSRTGRQGDAEDLASQVFEHAWRAADALQDRGLPPRAWLFGIARNVVAEHRRSLFRRPPALELSAFDGHLPGVDHSTDQLELARAIAALPRGDAEVITLRFLHGLSLQETAEAMQTSLDAVKSRQSRALKRLRGLLGEVA